MHKISALVCTVLCIIMLSIYTQLPLQYIDNLPNSVSISYDDVGSLHYKNLTFDYDLYQHAGINCTPSGTIDVKAFGWFTLKRMKAKVEPNRKVFQGGQPIGLTLNSNGVIVTNSGNIKTKEGMKGSEVLKKGDIIKKINDTPILNPKSIAEFFKDNKCEEIEITVERNGKLVKFKTSPIYDSVNNEYKLGAWVKDKIAGLGTISYVRLDNRFGALGHPVIDNDTNLVFPVYDGKVYNAKVVGVEKGQSGKAGALKGVFNASDGKIGTVQSNNKYGIFGTLSSQFEDKIMPVGSRLNIKPGKAKIISTVNDKLDEYEIEIVKTHSQKKKSDKSMVVKVTDPRLLETTGGIVQGMSGSPIIQDDKVIGAITHVFVNDPTRGYGIYLDWMYDN